MATHTVSFETDPEGIPFMVTLAGIVSWFAAESSYTLEDGTVIRVQVPPSGQLRDEDDIEGYKFRAWDDENTETIRDVTVSEDHSFEAIYTSIRVYPTKHPIRRNAKFAAKNDEEVAALRVTALKPIMVSEQASAVGAQVHMEMRVGRYLYGLGLFGHQLHHYRNFSQQIFRLKRLYTDQTLWNEANAAAEAWAAKGLVWERLVEVAKLQGINLSITSAPSSLILLI